MTVGMEVWERGIFFLSFNKQIKEKLKKMCDPIHRIKCIIRLVHSINQVAPNCYSKWFTGEGFGRTLTLESTMVNTSLREFKSIDKNNA